MTAKPAQLEDLYKGARVRYSGGRTGVVADLWPMLDEFWIRDVQSGEIIRDEFGAQRVFRSSDLQIQAQPKKLPPTNVGASQGRVLLIGTQDHMLSILRKFGAADTSTRKDPQMVLAFPCSDCCCGSNCAEFDPMGRNLCDMECPMMKLAIDGLDDDMLEFARNQRPDTLVAVRPYHLKQAHEALGEELQRLEDHFCLSAVSVPYGLADIRSTSDATEREIKEQVRCQIDIGVSSEGFLEPGDASLQQAAKRSLSESLKISLADELWTDERQQQIRRGLGVAGLPLKYWDGSETKVFVLVLPPDATSKEEKGLLRFVVKSAMAAPGVDATHKTVKEWREEQDEFKDSPKLPPGWIRVKSTAGKTYYYHTARKQSTYDFPLPEGWTKQVSKSSGKSYFFHSKKRKSTYDLEDVIKEM